MLFEEVTKYLFTVTLISKEKTVFSLGAKRLP